MRINVLIQKWEQEYKLLEEKRRKVGGYDLIAIELIIYRRHLRELKEAWNIEVEDLENDLEDTGFVKWAEETAEESLRVLRDRDQDNE